MFIYWTCSQSSNSGTRWCLVCNRNVGGGTRNFDKHEASKPHLDNVARAAHEKPPQPITNFFSRPKPTPPTLNMGPQLIAIASKSTFKNPPIPSKGHPLITRLRALVASLPTSVPIGTDNDEFACFVVDLMTMVQPGNDLWEDVINPTYDWVIGFGRSALDIVGLIRRGQYRMVGFCNWSEACIERLDILPSLLEGRLGKVMQAMINMYVYYYLLA